MSDRVALGPPHAGLIVVTRSRNRGSLPPLGLPSGNGRQQTGGPVFCWPQIRPSPLAFLPLPIVPARQPSADFPIKTLLKRGGLD